MRYVKQSINIPLENGRMQQNDLLQMQSVFLLDMLENAGPLKSLSSLQ